MKTLPSKELFIEVLNIKIENIKKSVDDFSLYGVVIENEMAYLRNKNTLFDLEEICIYKLAYKCKEWAIKKEFIVTSQINTYASYSYIGLDELYGGFIKEFEANTEPEAIFKACEWIMEQTK